jgi:hypothetical protein
MTTAAITDVAVEKVDVHGVRPQALVPGLGNVTATFALVGASNAVAKKIRLTGLHLTTPTPAVVLLQPRQSDNRDLNLNDEFAVEVITTAKDNIVILIRRLDSATGWSQNLRIDVFIVDNVVNP